LECSREQPTGTAYATPKKKGWGASGSSTRQYVQMLHRRVMEKALLLVTGQAVDVPRSHGYSRLKLCHRGLTITV